MTSKKEIFSDIDMAFIAHPINGELSRKLNKESVKQSVKSLILTDFYERPFKPDVGCNIRYYLFELFTQPIKQLMEESIKTTIKNHEPRADVLAVEAIDMTDQNAIHLSIAFMIKNDPEPVYLEMILSRVR